jgi:S-DNA-T family DNA segregation ATPase FtsK/SpoIIIE
MAKHKNKTAHKYPVQKLRPELQLGAETKRGIAVIAFLALFLIAALSLFNLGGLVGGYITDFLKLMFGYIAWFAPIVFLVVAVSLFKQKIDTTRESHFYLRIYLGSLLLIGGVAGLLYTYDFHNGGAGMSGGYLGEIFASWLYKATSFWVSLVVLILLIVASILIIFDISLNSLLPFGDEDSDETQGLDEKNKIKVESGPIKINGLSKTGFIAEKVTDRNKILDAANDGDDFSDKKASFKKDGPVIAAPIKETDPNIEAIQRADRTDWKLPPFDLLDQSKTVVDSGNIEANVSVIQKTLSDFGIEVEMGEVNVGPTVTQYTLRPAVGVKLAQIAGLQNDLALALSASSLRMELPIPGKALVGIEIPNKTTGMVHLREVLQTKDFVNNPSTLAFGLGRDVAGHPVVVDLARMPHLLVAGATGTGKSVAINSFLISLLYKNTPQDVKFILIDPKRVEMNLYNGIPHLLTPVIIEHDKAVNALKWAVGEMDRRYRVLSEAGKRNISEYNETALVKMHYIVVVVDELADLMSVAQRDVEASIVRLSQMARAIGIHLLLATQRPSVEIITGLIKANITSRIAFAVASQIDSRTILDAAGAEKLLGRGDMLFICSEIPKPKRIQGTYLSEKEVKAVVDFFKEQSGAVIYNNEIVEKSRHQGSLYSGGSDEDGDALLAEAEQAVRQAGKASASLLQRRLRVGYARAARLLDLLEERGIIGPGDGAKPREVYGKEDMASVADEDYGNMESEDSDDNGN